MEDKLNQLFQAWHKLGAAVLVAQSPDSQMDVPTPEKLIAESTAYCRHSSRLAWVVLDWLIKNKDKINVAVLMNETKKSGNLAVLGLLANAACEFEPDEIFDSIMKGCAPNRQPDFFFYRVKNSKLASRLTMENPLPVFQKWNFWCNELRYLNEKQLSKRIA